MVSLLILAVAAALFVGVDKEKVEYAYHYVKQNVDAKKAIALVLVAVAFAFMPWGSGVDDAPTPEPLHVSIDLKGRFVGPTASEDASIVGNMCLEIADEVEWDGHAATPIYRTGVAVDDLRKTVRVLRCRGISIGDRQPSARDVIASYLESKVGTHGGDLTPEQRAAWVEAFRDVGQAAIDAAQ